MVIIIKHERRNRADLLLIPKRVFNDMEILHVQRVGLNDRTNTCFVSDPPDWLGIPDTSNIVSIIIDTFRIDLNRLVPGEVSYIIPEEFLQEIRLREFNVDGNPISNPSNRGFIRMRCLRIKSGIRAIQKAVTPYGDFNIWERTKIKGALRDLEKKHENVFIWIAHHIHPTLPGRRRR